MAVTTDPFVAADLAAVIPEWWTPDALEQLFAKTVFMNWAMDFSVRAASGGSLIDIPDVYTNSFTVTTQSTQGAEITTAGPAQVKLQLSINTHKYIAHIIGDKDKAQLMSDFDFNGVYARKTGGALADAIEADLGALWSSITTNTVGDTATMLVDAEIRQGVNKLASTNFDLRECAFFFHPYIFWVQLGSIAKYYDASQLGLLGNPALGFVRQGNFGPMDVSRGLVGQLYGIPIFTTTNVVSGLQTYRNMLLHREAIMFATQTPGGSTVRIQAQNRIANIGLLTVSDVIYGVKILREPAAVLLNGSSSFIGS